MASVKNLKKELEYKCGDLIDRVLVKDSIIESTPQVEAIIEEILVFYDDVIIAINAGKKAENKKAHFKGVYSKLENVAGQLVEKINAL